MDMLLTIKDRFLGRFFHFIGKRTIKIINDLGSMAIFFIVLLPIK